ncbi:MAG: peptidoglycan DD-metalloendopeptidase family protein [Pseudomonadota bacterium]
MRRVPWTAAGVALLLAALVLPAAQPERRRSEAETKAAQLKTIKEQEERARRRTQRDAAEEAEQTKALRDAERATTRVNRDLSSLRGQRAQRAAARLQLVNERSRRQAEKEATESDLASQLRAAYLMGRSEPLKLLLNQRNPAEFGRNLTYYGYLGRLRAGQIATITANIARIDELTSKIDEEDAKLAENMVDQKQRLDEREALVKQRNQVLITLKEQARNNATELKRLRTQRQELEQLVKELNRAAQAAPFDPDSPFAQRKKKLSWPVAGRIVTNFGARGAGDLPSEGIEIDAARGEDVRAVHEGIVQFADYYGLRGNMLILDHGDGYWSLYAHVDELFKAKGAKVAAGEKIGTVGDTGGRPRPGLYFQIFHNSKPMDPRGWFQSSTPPSR